MEMQRNAQHGSGVAGILSAILLCLAAVLAAAQWTPASGALPQLSLTRSATGGMGVADQPSVPVIHTRTFLVVGPKPDETAAGDEAGGTDLALPADAIDLSEHTQGVPIVGPVRDAPAGHTDCGYDACAPPALI